MTDTEITTLLSRLDEEAALSDEEVLEESRLVGEDPVLVAVATRNILFSAISSGREKPGKDAAWMAYHRFRPVLLLTLSRLSAIGIGCSLPDGLKLIRDFCFVEQPAYRQAELRDVIGAFLSYAHKTARFQLNALA